MNWRNRIISTGEADPAQLVANPDNWRIHPQDQQAAMEGALDEIGWLQSVTVNTTTGNLIDGHMRVFLALKHELGSVPVQYVELTEREEKKALMTLDPIGKKALTDAMKFDALLKEATPDSQAIQSLLNDMCKDEGLYNVDVGEGSDPPEPNTEPQDIPESFAVILEFETEEEQTAALDRFITEGYKCQSLT